MLRILLLHLLISINVFAQPALKTLHSILPKSEYVFDSKVTRDGGLVLSGCITDTGTFSPPTNALLIKLDAELNIQWAKDYTTGSLELLGASVDTLDNGGFLISGKTSSNLLNQQSVIFIFTDSIGNVTWSKVLDGMVATKSLRCANSDFIFSGQYPTTTGTYGHSSLAIWRFDSNGNFKWGNCYANDRVEGGDIIREDADGNIIVGGDSRDIPMTNDCKGYLLKTDSLGNLIWAKHYNSGTRDWIDDFLIDSNGDYLTIGIGDITGDWQKFISIDHLTGNVLWSKRFGVSVPGGVEWFRPKNMIFANSTIAICGWESGMTPALLLADLSGNPIWYKSFIDSIPLNYQYGGLFLNYVNDTLIFGAGAFHNYTDILLFKTALLEESCTITNFNCITMPSFVVDSEFVYTTIPLTDGNLINVTYNSVDYADSIHCSPLSSLIINPINKIINIFPNPAVDQVCIELDEYYENISFRLYNSLGSLVKVIKTSGTKIHILREQLYSGVYFFEIKSTGINRSHSTGKISFM